MRSVRTIGVRTARSSRAPTRAPEHQLAETGGQNPAAGAPYEQAHPAIDGGSTRERAGGRADATQVGWAELVTGIAGNTSAVTAVRRPSGDLGPPLRPDRRAGPAGRPRTGPARRPDRTRRQKPHLDTPLLHATPPDKPRDPAPWMCR